MNVVTTTTERFSFVCRRCRHEWTSEYQIRRWADSSGDDYTACSIAGLPVVPPWSGIVDCPACGGYRVALMPRRGIDRERGRRPRQTSRP